MTYPMIYYPTFTEFRAKLENEFGCEFKELPGKLREEGGESFPVTYFERKVGEKTLHYTVVIDDEDERVTLGLIKNACMRLELDATSFGLHLDEAAFWEITGNISDTPQ